MLKITGNSKLSILDTIQQESITDAFNLLVHKNDTDVFTITSRTQLNSDTKVGYLNHIISIEGIQHGFYNSLTQFGERLSNEQVYTAFEHLNIELITKSGEYVYLYNHKPFTAKINLKSSIFTLEIIHDAPFLHTTWDYSKGQRASSAAPIFSKGTNYEATFIIQKSNTRLLNCIPSYYPKTNKACFILTDHCDFDTTEKLNVFLYGDGKNGWLNKNIKITKGVFRYGPKKGEPRKSDDLEQPDYKNLIDKLHQDGSEICPHALKHSGQISGAEFNEGVAYLNTEYQPKSWIDHGSYLHYCYSQNGHLNPEYRTTKVLVENGYNNLWSFHDIALDPSLSLNYFHKQKYSKLNGVMYIIKHLIHFNFLFAAHYFRSFIHKSFGKSIVTDFLNYFFACSKIIFRSKKKNIKIIKEFLTKLSKFNEFRTSVSEPFTLMELNKFLPPVFTLNYQTINNWNGELLFFNTIETTHTKDIYTKKLLDNLINDKGLHLGHTYILNSLTYINGIFDSDSKTLKLSKEWIEFTEYLSFKVKNNEIWNPNMSEFVERMKLVLNVEYYLSENSVKLINKNNYPIDDFKLIQQNGNELIVNLPSNSVITVKYI
jgi:hypothetical protein